MLILHVYYHWFGHWNEMVVEHDNHGGGLLKVPCGSMWVWIQIKVNYCNLSRFSRYTYIDLYILYIIYYILYILYYILYIIYYILDIIYYIIYIIYYILYSIYYILYIIYYILYIFNYIYIYNITWLDLTHTNLSRIYHQCTSAALPAPGQGQSQVDPCDETPCACTAGPSATLFSSLARFWLASERNVAGESGKTLEIICILYKLYIYLSIYLSVYLSIYVYIHLLPPSGGSVCQGPTTEKPWQKNTYIYMENLFKPYKYLWMEGLVEKTHL